MKSINPGTDRYHGVFVPFLPVLDTGNILQADAAFCYLRGVGGREIDGCPAVCRHFHPDRKLFFVVFPVRYYPSVGLLVGSDCLADIADRFGLDDNMLESERILLLADAAQSAEQPFHQVA